MKQELTNLWVEQAKLKTSWRTLKNQYLSKIYDDVLTHKSVSEIHKDLYDLTINKKRYSKPLLAYMMKLATKVKKLDEGKGNYNIPGGLDILAIGIVSLYLKDAVNYKSNLIINQDLRKQESEMKDEILDNAFKEGRKSGKIFYVASSHKDSAKDHEKYQGKLYVDAYYNRHDEELREFVAKHNIRTVQWVTGEPVYFITRPHCRHYFRQYTFDEVKSGKAKAPIHKVGKKDMQTPRDANLEYYRDRLSMLESLYKVRKTQKLKDQILKTKILISKWQNQR